MATYRDTVNTNTGNIDSFYGIQPKVSNPQQEVGQNSVLLPTGKAPTNAQKGLDANRPENPEQGYETTPFVESFNHYKRKDPTFSNFIQDMSKFAGTQRNNFEQTPDEVVQERIDNNIGNYVAGEDEARNNGTSAWNSSELAPIKPSFGTAGSAEGTAGTPFGESDAQGEEEGQVSKPVDQGEFPMFGGKDVVRTGPAAGSGPGGENVDIDSETDGVTTRGTFIGGTDWKPGDGIEPEAKPHATPYQPSPYSSGSGYGANNPNNPESVKADGLTGPQIVKEGVKNLSAGGKSYEDGQSPGAVDTGIPESTGQSTNFSAEDPRSQEPWTPDPISAPAPGEMIGVSEKDANTFAGVLNEEAAPMLAEKAQATAEANQPKPDYQVVENTSNDLVMGNEAPERTPDGTHPDDYKDLFGMEQSSSNQQKATTAEVDLAFAQGSQAADVAERDPSWYQDPAFYKAAGSFFFSLISYGGDLGQAFGAASEMYDNEKGKQQRQKDIATPEYVNRYSPASMEEYARTGDYNTLTPLTEYEKAELANEETRQKIQQGALKFADDAYDFDVKSRMPSENRAEYERLEQEGKITKQNLDNQHAIAKEARESGMHPLKVEKMMSDIALQAARAEDIANRADGEGSGDMTSTATGRDIPSERLTEGKRKASAGASKAQAGLQTYQMRLDNAVRTLGEGTVKESEEYLMANPTGAAYSMSSEGDVNRWIMDTLGYVGYEGNQLSELARLHTAEASYIYPMMQAEGLAINPDNYMATRARYFEEIGGDAYDRVSKTYERDRAIEAQHITAGNFATNGQVLHPEERSVVSHVITGLSGGIEGVARKPNDPRAYYEINEDYAERFGLPTDRRLSMDEIKQIALENAGEQRGWGTPAWVKKQVTELSGDEPEKVNAYESEMERLRKQQSEAQ